MKLKGWKFIRSDHRMQFTDQRELIAGQVYENPLNADGRAGPLVLCERGFHASLKARDALRYARLGMTHVARVDVSGVGPQDDTKFCGDSMKVLWVADATQTLRLFMVWCRWKQMLHRLRGREPSLASLWALDAAERFILGEADEDEISAAYVAAAATYAAASDAAAAADAADVAAATYAATYAAAAAATYAAAAAVDQELTARLMELAP